jgi:hypothetical protein
MLKGLLLILVLMVFAIAGFAQADPNSPTEDKEPNKSYLYQWTDDAGIVHITDGLGKVPEKYREHAVKLIQQEKEEDDQVRQAPQVQSPSRQSNSNENTKAAWQQRIRQAKQRVSGLENRYRELDQRRNELLRSWGGPASGRLTERIEADEIEQEMKDVQKEIDDARRDVDSVIPEEARRAGVPPGWLRE